MTSGNRPFPSLRAFTPRAFLECPEGSFEITIVNWDFKAYRSFTNAIDLHIVGPISLEPQTNYYDLLEEVSTLNAQVVELQAQAHDLALQVVELQGRNADLEREAFIRCKSTDGPEPGPGPSPGPCSEPSPFTDLDEDPTEDANPQPINRVDYFWLIVAVLFLGLFVYQAFVTVPALFAAPAPIPAPTTRPRAIVTEPIATVARPHVARVTFRDPLFWDKVQQLREGQRGLSIRLHLDVEFDGDADLLIFVGKSTKDTSTNSTQFLGQLSQYSGPSVSSVFYIELDQAIHLGLGPTFELTFVVKPLVEGDKPSVRIVTFDFAYDL